MTLNEVHDLQQSGAASDISSLTVSEFNTQQACTFRIAHFYVRTKVYSERIGPVVCCVQTQGQTEDTQLFQSSGFLFVSK